VEDEQITYSNPLRPNNPGICVVTIVMADPVMKPLMAGIGMKSTIQAMRRSPMTRTMNPEVKPAVIAIVGLSHTPGCSFCTRWMTLAIVSDKTATGPIDTSLEVAKIYAGPR
jgi:hypothetical protein